LSQANVADLQGILASEQSHVSLIQTALTAAGVQPVAPCQYNFNFNTPAEMLATAAILENVGVSAYLGAAGFLTDAGILGTAASIATVESRHQSLLRQASKSLGAPQAFDTALSPKQVFTLAAPFIASCPQGSNLALTAFPPLAAAGNANANAKVVAGQSLALNPGAATGATNCAFINGGRPGNADFTAFVNNACVVPPNLSGIAFVVLTNSVPDSHVVTDDIILAGPMVMQIS
jgi:hypothetical protein